MPVATFERPETVVIKGTVKDESEILVTPDTSTLMTVTDPAGTVVVNGLTVTFDSIGIWRYLYTPGGSAVLGAYHVRVVATHSTRISIGDFQFVLVG